MEKEFNPHTGFDIGTAARNQALANGDQICRQERLRLELVNEPDINECKASLTLMCDEREQIQTFLGSLLHSALQARQQRRYYIIIALILALAGFSFAHMALAPFGLGVQVWLYSAGLAIVCAVLTDMLLEKCVGVRTVQVIVATAFVASLTGLILLAVIRGDIVLLYLKSALAGAVPDDGAMNGVVNDSVQFYKATAWKLQLFFGLLAAGMELATGLLVWEARKIIVAPQHAIDRARKRLTEIDQVMPLLVGRITFLQNEPRIFEAEFNRDFYRGLLQGPDRRIGLRVGPLLLAVLGGFVLALAARAQTATVVTAIDFSQSDNVAMYNGGNAHQENVEAAAKTIAGLPPGTKFSVIGITAASFSRPMVLVSSQIPREQGPLTFLNRVTLASNKYAAEVRKVGNSIKPSAATTDILGSLMLAAEIFGQSPRTKCILVIFGDMRQSASPVNIENPQVVPITAALKTAERAHLIANLKDVDVFVYGVHAAGKDAAYFYSLRDFWRAYFAKAGGTLRTFSMLREVPNFTGGAKD